MYLMAPCFLTINARNYPSEATLRLNAPYGAQCFLTMRLFRTIPQPVKS